MGSMRCSYMDACVIKRSLYHISTEKITIVAKKALIEVLKTRNKITT